MRFLLFLLLCGVMQGCGKDYDVAGDDISRPVLERGDSASRTVLVYIMAENKLAGNVNSDLYEMKRGLYALPDDCYLLAFVDDLDKPYICRFYKSKLGVSACDTVYKFQNDFYSTDSAKFKEVLSWVLCEYPSRHLGLVMWSHGSGWLYDARKVRSIGVDNGKNVYGDILSTSKCMEVEELAYVLEDIPVKTDFVLFDACFMQCVEVAYAMRKSTDWLLGSPAELPADGAPYDKIVSSMFSFPFDAKGFIEQYKAGYPENDGVVLSAVNCLAVDKLAEITSMVVPAYFTRGLQVDDSKVFSYLPGGNFSDIMEYPEYSDMNGQMMLRLPNDVYLLWKEAFDAAVPYKVASRKWWSGFPPYDFYPVDFLQYGGLSMYVPRDKVAYSSLNANFRKTEWYLATEWGSAGW